MLLFSELTDKQTHTQSADRQIQLADILNLKVTIDSDMGHLDLSSEFKEDISKEMKSDITRHLYSILKNGIDYSLLVTKPDSRCIYACTFYKPLLQKKSIKTKVNGKNLQLNITFIDTTKNLKI